MVLDVWKSGRAPSAYVKIGLPGTDGYELASSLVREEWSRDAVLIAVSGYGEAEARERSKKAGFHHHMVKPINFDTILALLGRP